MPSSNGFTNIVNSYDLSSFIVDERYKRTPDGYQYVENQCYHRELQSFAEANITNNSITIIRKRPRRRDGTHKRSLSPSQLANLSKPRYTGLMTTSCVHRLKKSFDSLLFNTRPFDTIDPDTLTPRKARMVGWTLTLPDTCLINGRDMWKLFKQFRWNLQRKGILFPYVAKLEFHGNNQPHLHVDVIQYLNYTTMYSTWEHTLQLSGYLHQWRSDHPNEDIQGCKFTYLWDDQQCEDYLWNYVKKGRQNSTPAGCRIWSCSDDLKNPQNRRISLDSAQIKLLRRATSTDQCKYYEKTCTITPKERPGKFTCLNNRQHVVFRRWKFKSHEHLISFLTITNKRVVSDHKKRYRYKQSPPDDRCYIFDRNFSITPVVELDPIMEELPFSYNSLHQLAPLDNLTQQWYQSPLPYPSSC